MVCLGKQHKAYRQEHTIKIHEADETSTVQYFTLEDVAVMPAPDVQEYFPDLESVNKALDFLIKIMPKKRK